MEPTTLAAIGIGLYFLLVGGDKKNGKKDDPTPDPDDCPKGYTRNAQGQCVAKGTTVDCAPGLVRGNDGKCRKKIKAKPGDDVDPNDISDVKPDVIADDDAWIAPGCTSLFYGPDFFRQTMVPAVLEYVDAGYGFTPSFYAADIPFDVGALASTGPNAVIAGMLGTYRPDCADLLQAWTADNVPTQAQVDAYQAEYKSAYSAFMSDEISQGQFDAVQANDPVIRYIEARQDFLKTLPGVGQSVRDLAVAINTLINDRGNQNMGGTFAGPGKYGLSYPARFTPKAEDFA
jgi:hypothetical protein